MAHTISLSNPRQDLDPALLQARGGFAWWYLDHVDEDGNGLVMIWSFGLPFLPGYLGAARAGQAEAAGARPSLNLVLYEAGRPAFYLLQEYAPERCEWTPDAWRFADTRIALARLGDHASLSAAIDCPIPNSGDRLTGTVRVQGPLARIQGAPAPCPEHEWSPVLGPAHLQAKLRIGDTPVIREGLAYHDRNGGRVPLDGLGIRRWTWGRWVRPEALDIYYVLWPEDPAQAVDVLGVRIDAEGRGELREDLTVDPRGHRRAAYGMPHIPQLSLQADDGEWMKTKTTRILDDGPFYLRTLIRGAEAGYGIGEWVDPARIDKAWQRPFVRMRVHHADAGNSAWLPLFSGPKQGRLQRLVSGGRV